ncbi:NADP oxidoreductase coenzyme F420-dependent [Rosistilla oblonga]|uniref:NADP oxidoreductase coenzyme F420-dependent n=1 Tax=Rosistilla ulvae TaxID=1930277 RepID=A0A517M5X7_9BACT|nr:NADP oxidoreductase coenzyme F420-dependent [Rosistilla ulvae]QDV14416.1 NADP oxidoreductase coenzyme F420-dependent [Rosistilla oblonga]
MDIAVLGTGNVGATLGRRLAGLGHNIVFGSRLPQSERVQQLIEENPHAHAAETIAEAARQCDTILFAAPWTAARETLTNAGDLTGKTLIDCTNPLNETFDGITLGHTESAAEKIAHWAAGAHVVKAFNTASLATMENPDFDGQRATMFYCGDDITAKATAGTLIDELGFEAIDAGDLQSARYLEPMAMLYIQLAIHQKMGSQFALKMLRR